MKIKDWEKKTAVNALLATGREGYVTTARELINRTVAVQTADGVLNYDNPKPWIHGDDPHRAQCEPATMGHGVLGFTEQTDDDRYLESARAVRVPARRYKADRRRAIAYSTEPVELCVDSIYRIYTFLPATRR